MEAKTGPLILCVDDERVGLQVRKLLLERAGYRVLSAMNGYDAIELFDLNPIEAVVLDYSMPGMNGGEVAAILKQRRPETPILLLSAYMGLASETTALVDIYMTKGEGAPALLERLEIFFPHMSPSIPASVEANGKP